MSKEVRLIATKDIPGISARLAGTGYRTRRIKAGDEFYVSDAMGNLMVNGLKRAQYNREPGRVPAPPARVIERAAAAAPPAPPAPPPPAPAPPPPAPAPAAPHAVGAMSSESAAPKKAGTRRRRGRKTAAGK